MWLNLGHIYSTLYIAHKITRKERKYKFSEEKIQVYAKQTDPLTQPHLDPEEYLNKQASRCHVSNYDGV